MTGQTVHHHAGPADGYPLFTDLAMTTSVFKPGKSLQFMPAAWNPDGENWVDYGLGDFLKSAGNAPEVYEPEMGKFKVPTLRNVDLRPSEDFVKPYGHNGYFKSLEDIVFFYHWRAMMDSMADGWRHGCDGMADVSRFGSG
jgi:cytochrome c peroxidase